MSARRTRVAILCEDRRQELFVRRLLERLLVKPVFTWVEVAPAGRGDAKQWVRSQYAAVVQRHRRAGSDARVVLVAMRDGDNSTPAARVRDLDEALRESRLRPRGRAERIACPVPTWSIETWVLWLTKKGGKGGISEKRSYKDKIRDEAEFSRMARDAASAWSPARRGEPASLAHGRGELARLG